MPRVETAVLVLWIGHGVRCTSCAVSPSVRAHSASSAADITCAGMPPVRVAAVTMSQRCTRGDRQRWERRQALTWRQVKEVRGIERFAFYFESSVWRVV